MFGTPRKGRKRLQGASGLTPRSKRLTPKRTPQKQTYTRWSAVEKEDLINFVKQSGDAENTDWKKCAEVLNEKHGKTRTAKQYQQTYKRSCTFPLQKTSKKLFVTQEDSPVHESTRRSVYVELFGGSDSRNHTDDDLQSLSEDLAYVKDTENEVLPSCDERNIKAFESKDTQTIISFPSRACISFTLSCSDSLNTPAKSRQEPSLPLQSSSQCNGRSYSHTTSTPRSHNSIIRQLLTCSPIDLSSDMELLGASTSCTSTPLPSVDDSATLHSLDISAVAPITVITEMTQCSKKNTDSSKENIGDHSYARPTLTKKTTSTKKFRSKKKKTASRVGIAISQAMNKFRDPITTPEKKRLRAFCDYSSNPRLIAATIVSIPKIKNEVLNQVFRSLGSKPKYMRNTVHGFVSVLTRKSREDLDTFAPEEVFSEFYRMFPEVVTVLLHIMLPQDHLGNSSKIDNVLTRLAMVYAIIMQTRNHELSAFQRVVSMCLLDNVVDQKVYDRLNPLGVCLSYERTLSVVKQIGGQFRNDLVQALKEGKQFRLCGDNMNFAVGVGDERHDRHKHLRHWFLSIALVYNHQFSSLSSNPLIPIEELNVSHVLLSPAEYKILREDVITIISEIVAEHMPQLAHLISKNSTTNYTHVKTEVIRLPAWPLNEQRYQDVVKILENYESIVEKTYKEAGILPENQERVHIGGDQLTRERFSNSINLRLGNENQSDAFSLLGPVTFEFFHLKMNFLEKVIFRRLYDEESDLDIGSMKAEANRLNRKNITPDVIKAYDDDKDFFISFYKSYVMEAFLEYLQLDGCNSIPVDLPGPESDPRLKKQWLNDTIGPFVDQMIYPAWSNEGRQDQSFQGTKTIYDIVKVHLPDGTELPVRVPRQEVIFTTSKADKVKDYANLVLECGTQFCHLLRQCKSPDRTIMLPLLKMVMMTMKCNNSMAKYPLELLRMLVQQYSLLSEKAAHQTFAQCFVNTKGKPDTYVPCDLVMEWAVRDEKRHIKHMVSNKNDANILHRSSALGGIERIAENFDSKVGVRLRFKKHSEVSSIPDEQRMIEDLRQVRPFSHKPGRCFNRFKTIVPSMLNYREGHKFKSWFEKHKSLFDA